MAASTHTEQGMTYEGAEVWLPPPAWCRRAISQQQGVKRLQMQQRKVVSCCKPCQNRSLHLPVSQ